MRKLSGAGIGFGRRRGILPRSWKRHGLDQRREAARCRFYLMAMICLTAAGCGGSSAPKVTPAEIAPDAGEKAVKEFDTNNDGKLDYNELAKAPGLRDGLAKIKKLAVFRGPPPTPKQLQSATITAEEINARIQEWKAQGVVRVRVPCRVYRVSKASRFAQQPIVGAEVKFVPESFLGNGLATVSGTTDAKGMVSLSQPGGGKEDEAQGMSPGFYRVEITKGKEIPAQYNTATTLGAEVAADGLHTTTGFMFELEY